MSQAESAVTSDAGVQPLDVRTLAPRERHQVIFERLGALDTGETLRLINDHDPVPLRYQLEAEYPDQYQWVNGEAGPERWIVDITSKARVVDARPVIASGGEPFQTIMEAAVATNDDEVLVIYAPFEPMPLKEALAERGLGFAVDQVSEDTWRVMAKRQ